MPMKAAPSDAELRWRCQLLRIGAVCRRDRARVDAPVRRAMSPPRAAPPRSVAAPELAVERTTPSHACIAQQGRQRHRGLSAPELAVERPTPSRRPLP